MAVKDFLSDHEYDGIREYDNPTPGWWHAIFIATIAFSFFYFVYWEMNPRASTPQSRWAAAQTPNTNEFSAPSAISRTTKPPSSR